MNIIGIVVEYNPFHNGHLYQINKVKELYPDSTIIVVMSSSFTQRGEISILNKWQKTEISLHYGIDLIIELPYIFSVQGADKFAKGAITILNSLKIDTLVFGSETTDLKKLLSVSKIQLNNKNFDKKLKVYLNEGINYPTAISKTIKDLTKYSIKESNEILAISYIKEILKQNDKINIVPILRDKNYEDMKLSEKIESATIIRNKLKIKENIKKYVPSFTYKYLKNVSIDYNKYFLFLKYKILSSKDLSIFLDVNEGIENRILKAAAISNNLEELINNIKSKRYTYNKICRMLNHILIGFTKESNIKYQNIDYIRILGFSNKGKKHLNNIKKEINLPILSKFNNKYELLQFELSITKIYSIILNDSKLIEKEYMNKPLSF